MAQALAEVAQVYGGPSEDGWSCPQCTFVNAGGLLSCEICQGPCPVSDTSAKVREAVSAKIDWTQFLAHLRVDINNQTEDAERAITRKGLIDWATKQADNENAIVKAHDIYYDYRPVEEFGEGEAPTEGDNEYQPFLSAKVLEDILISELQILQRVDDEPTDQSDC